MTDFAKFSTQSIPVNSDVAGPLDIHARMAGSGHPLLLIHGYPQTSHIWRHVAGPLSEKYSVVAVDLRGYGQSSKPRGSDTHIEYSKREMANDLTQVMSHLGHSRFSIIGHDRGARVAYRLALDYPEKVDKMILLDIAPTLWMYEHTDMAFAMGYWHWFFLTQPAPQVEDVILASPQKFWSMLAQRKSHMGGLWSDEDVEEYQRHYFQPDAIHAACEDYRAAATIDLSHDRADRTAGTKLAVKQVKVIWGSKGLIETFGDVVSIWKEYCGEGVEVSGHSVECGHYIPEAKGEELVRIALEFLG